ncbi:hypothetical protein K437DRAFT_254443 [Tilletiaria anomala UBC 951]|uniref:F-box domain-containing protein n=1 Tax=Tilletiaria anomala (strain ATCC 24038 / CBS 436.72 / UBC 951) TaxID=1037660 RepID=A0A066WE70_TILAU|nr:uncharacterized protein K437DRAFT_254443 [Tilletiaria anomala UBC 951]KDN52252.1 hypothetical protein K437DRAFT_254443 [Tilletiaria anomala UBC 951]
MEATEMCGQPEQGKLADLPHELLVMICQLAYLDAIPKTSFRTLDPHSLPSSYPDGRSTSSPHLIVQRTLYSLCLVNKSFYHAARPLLFRKIRITLPYSFLLLLRTLGASHLASAYETFSSTGDVNLDPTDPASFVNMVAAVGFAHATGGKLVVSVPSTRTASPYRGRTNSGSLWNRSLSKESVSSLSAPVRPVAVSPAREGHDTMSSKGKGRAPSGLAQQSHRAKFLTDEDGEVELVWAEEDLLSETASSASSEDEIEEEEDDSPDMNRQRDMDEIFRPPRRRQIQRYHVTLSQDAVLTAVHKWVRILDFSTYRTQGLRRTIGEGHDARFVTPARLLALITACSDGLVAFGASETMDSALSKDVLEALLFRGGQQEGGSASGAPPDDFNTRGRRTGCESNRLRSSGAGGMGSRALRGVSIERKRRDDAGDGDATNHVGAAEGLPKKKMLQSLDLCNCVSSKFQDGLSGFVEEHLKKFSGRLTHTLDEEDGDHDAGESSDDDDEHRGRGRGRGRDRDRDARSSASRPAADGNATSTAGGAIGASRSICRSTSRARSASHNRDRGSLDANAQPSRHPARATHFPSVLRLGLSGVTFTPDILHPFVLAFPRLTHLDLSRTKIDSSLLHALAKQGPESGLALQSLSLAHCRRITSESIVELLVESPVAWNLTELSLECSIMFPSPLTSDDLTHIIRRAPAFRSGCMRYLDIGGCPVTDEHLQADFAPQPSLLDLGLGNNPQLSLPAIGNFLKEKAPNVQIMDLADSCQMVNGSQLGAGPGGLAISASALNKHVLSPCTESPPVPLAMQLALMGFNNSAGITKEEAASFKLPQPATNLRVIGLSDLTLNSVSDGIGSWRVVRGAGRRGWVVDTTAGPNPQAKDEDSMADVIAQDLSQHQNGRGRRLASNTFSAVRRATSIGGSHHSLSPVRSQSHSQPRFSPSPLRSASHSRALAQQQQHALAAANDMTRSGPLGGAMDRMLLEDDEQLQDAQSAAPLTPRDEVVRGLPEDHPRVQALRSLVAANGHVPGSIGWHSKKMEVLLGFGMLGRETGSYAHVAYQV